MGDIIFGIIGVFLIAAVVFALIEQFYYWVVAPNLSIILTSLAVILIVIVLSWITYLISKERKKNKERKLGNYKEEHSCPICLNTGVLNGIDKYTEIKFNNEHCYSCEGKKYSDNPNEQMIYKIIKECDFDSRSRNITIEKLHEYLNKINDELQKAGKILQSTALDSLIKSKEITERDIKYNATKINQNEVIKKKLIPILYNLHIFRVISKGSSENNSMDTISDFKSVYVVTEKTKSIANSIFEEMTALSIYLNDKTESNDEFLRQIEDLTSELKNTIK